MTLAQVAYTISTDEDFAEQYRTDPETALATKGLALSKEELAFLKMGMDRYDPARTTKIKLDEMNVAMWGWTWY